MIERAVILHMQEEYFNMRHAIDECQLLLGLLFAKKKNKLWIILKV